MCGAILLVFDFFASTWIGMTMALKKEKHQRAILATFLRVMLPPWLAIVFFIFLGAIGAASGSTGDIFSLVFIWFFGCALLDLLMAGRARMILLAELRSRAYDVATARGLEHELTFSGAFEGTHPV
jgi:hypothetical protein